jgi:hypothetical protein
MSFISNKTAYESHPPEIVSVDPNSDALLDSSSEDEDDENETFEAREWRLTHDHDRSRCELSGIRLTLDGNVETFSLPYTKVYSERYAKKKHFFKHRVDILSSPWGSGKTQKFIEYVADRMKAGTLPAFILVVTPRISLAEEDVVRFNKILQDAYDSIPVGEVEKRKRAETFQPVSYLQKDTPADRITAVRCFVICSLQSLHKLAKSPFYRRCVEPLADCGLVFMDEIEEIAKSMSLNETTGHHLVKDARTLKAICQKAAVMMCDAWPDVSAAILAYIITSGDIDADAIRCILNEFRPDRRIMIAHDSLSSFCDCIVKDLSDDAEECKKNGKVAVTYEGIEYTFQTHKFVVASDNKAKAVIVASILRRLGVKVKLYTADSSQLDKAFLRDDVLSPDCDVVVFSPAIDVGVDLSMVGLFYRVYSIITFQGCPMRCVFQMIKRARNPILPSIPCYIGRQKDVFRGAEIAEHQDVLETSSKEEEDAATDIDAKWIAGYMAEKRKNAAIGTKHYQLFGQDAMQSTDAHLIQNLSLLDAVAKYEMFVTKRHPREALFRALRYANIGLIRSANNLSSANKRKFIHLHRHPRMAARPRLVAADAVKAKRFFSVFNATTDKALEQSLFYQSVVKKGSDLLEKATFLSMIGNRDILELLNETTTAEGVPPPFYDYLPQKYGIVMEIARRLEIPCAMSCRSKTKYSTTIDPYIEEGLKRFLEPRITLFTYKEKAGVAMKLPLETIPIASTSDKINKTVPAGVEGERDKAIVDEESSSDDELESLPSDDELQEEVVIAAKKTKDENDTQPTNGIPEKKKEEKIPTKRNPFYWSTLALNIFFAYTNAIPVWKDVNTDMGTAHVDFENHLTKLTLFEKADYICRMRGGVPCYADDAFAIEPEGDETIHERFRRALKLGKKLDAEPLMKIFHLTMEELETESKALGLDDIHLSRSLYDMTKPGAFAHSIQQRLDTHHKKHNEYVDRVHELAERARRIEHESRRQLLETERKTKEIADRDQEIADKDREIADKDREIARLKNKIERKRKPEESTARPGKACKLVRDDFTGKTSLSKEVGLSDKEKESIIAYLKRRNIQKGVKINYGELLLSADIPATSIDKVKKFVDHWRNGK